MTELVVVNQTETIVIEDTGENLVTRVEVVQVVESAPQGPPGRQGDPGQAGVQYLTLQAGEALGGHRAVVVVDGEAFYASADNPLHANAVVGITLQAANIGTPINVQTTGTVTEPSWAWVPYQPIFLGLGGVLTQVYTPGAFNIVVGQPITSTSMSVNIKQPIIL